MNSMLKTQSWLVRSSLGVLVAAVAVGTASMFVSLAGTPGIDGALTVTAANTVINQYSGVTAVTSTTITVTDIANLTSGAPVNGGALAAGDIVMLYQSNGATIDQTNTIAYGAVTAYGSAGKYQTVTVDSIAGNVITIAGECGALTGFTAANTQVIRVPQLSSLTVSAGGSIVATSWNGTSGGIVAANVSGATTLNGVGAVNVSGQGFRGAAPDINGATSAFDATVDAAFVKANATFGVQKGEGIAGLASTLASGGEGRGAPANGGGAGNGHNAGGGGGSNAGAQTGYNGTGTKSVTTANWANAWNLESAGFATNVSPGGGRGGYTYSSSNQDALTVAPGAAAWGGDQRDNVGGFGGHPLDVTGNRLFLGGGGGAGEWNGGGAASTVGGGNGGGLVYLTTGSLAGTASILANGAVGGNSGSGTDSASGAGGGGAIVIDGGATAPASISLTASGGKGGDQIGANTAETEGPGGGGGGGYIAANGGTKTAAGGANGVTSGTQLSEFTPNGATEGTTGTVTTAPSSTGLFCYTPRIGIAKSVGTPVVSSADNSTYDVPYTVNLQSYGEDLTGVTVTDSLAATFPGATISVTAGPTLSAISAGSALTLNSAANFLSTGNLVTGGNLARLATGADGTATITFTVRVRPPAGTTSATVFNNTATAGGSFTPPGGTAINTTDTSNSGTNPDVDGDRVPNEASDNVPTPVSLPVADLSLTKTTSSAAPPVGTNVTFTITVSNSATSSNVAGVSVLEQLPSGYAFVSATPSQGTYVSGTGVWTVGAINAGASANLQILATVRPTGPYGNTAQVSASSLPDPDSVPNNSVAAEDDQATNTPVPVQRIDLSTTKTASTLTPNVGSNVTFTVTVANAANFNDASGVSVTDLLPSGYAYFSSTPSQGTYVPATGVWTVGAVASNASANIQIVATVLGSGSYINTAQVTAAGQTDFDSTPNDGIGDDFATLTPTPAPRIDLSATKTFTPASAAVGSNVTFTVTVSNAANLSSATGVAITDLLPSGYTLVSSTATQGTYVPATGVWTVGTVNSGSSANIQILATVLPSGTYANTAQVSAADQTDIDSLPNDGIGDDFASATPPITPAIDLSVTKTSSPANPPVGSDVTFTVTVANAANLSSATGVAITDLLPSGYTLVSSTATQGTYVPATGVWTVGTVNSGSSANIQIVGTVLGTGIYANTAQVTAAGQTDIDSTPNDGVGDDFATNTPTPAPRVDLSTTKTFSPATPSVGSNVTFTVTVSNAANLSNATGVSVLDQLPSGYTFVSATPSQGTYVAGTGVWTTGTINAGSSANLQIVATILGSGTYKNDAQVSAAGQTDLDSTPNDGVGDDFATATPPVTPAIDLSVTKTSSPANPPVGSNVTFTVTVANAANLSSATGVAVTDLLPSGYTFVSGTASQGSYISSTGVWTVGTVNAGSSANIQLVGTVLPSGTYANTAQVTAAGQTDIDSTPGDGVGDDFATDTPTPAPRIDLSTTKTFTPAAPVVGSNVTFTVTVANAAGLNNATGVALADLLPSGYTLVSSTPSQGTYVAGTGVWTVGTVNSGSSANLQIVATVLGTGIYANTAQVTAAGQTDVDSLPNDGVGDDFASATPPITPAIDLSVTKTSSPVNPAVGSNVTFTVTVANAANLSSATGVAVTDLLPSGYTFVSFTASQGTYVSSTGVWTVGSVNSGSSANIQLIATVLATGTYANSAQVTAAGQTDIDSTPGDGVGDDFATNTPTPSPRIDLSLTKTSSPVSPAVGSNVTFTVTVANAANLNNATGVNVTDLLPSGYTFVSATPSQGTYVSGTGAWTVGAINSGSSANLQIVATVLATGTYGNTAQVVAAGQTDIDSTPNNNLAAEDDQATDTPTPAPRINLSVTKTAAPANPSVGSNVTFTVTVTNAANLNNATGVVVRDQLPSGYTLVSSTPSQGTYVPGTGVWTVGTVNSGSSANLQIVATVLATGVYKNDAEVTAAGQTDTNSLPNDGTGDDFATITPGATPIADLSLTKTSSPSSPAVGSNVTFTVTVPNAGPSTATGVVVKDSLPSGYTFVSSTPSQGTYVTGTGIWTIGNINSGSSVTLTVVATVKATGVYGNTAEVTAVTETDPDSAPNNNNPLEDDQGTNTPTPSPRIDLSVTKTSSPANPAVTSNVTFTVTVANAANLNDATGVAVTDLLPSGYSFVSFTASQGTYVAGTGVWTVGTVASGSSANIQIVGTVLATGTYANSAQVTAAGQTDIDSTPGDGVGDDFASDTPTPSPRIDLSLTKTVAPSAPTIGSDVTFTVTVSNAANLSNATSVSVLDQLPTGYTLVSNTPSQGTYVAGTGVWTVGTVNSGSSANLQIVATVLATGSYANTAQVSAAAQTDLDSTPNNSVAAEDDQATSTPIPNANIDLSVTKTSSPANPPVGSNVTFTVNVANATGFSSATGVAVTDLLPSGYTFVSFTASQGTYVSSTGVWTVGTVASGSSANIQIVGTVLGSGTYANTAQVTAANQTDIDSTPGDGAGDDFASNTPTPAPRVDLSVVKTASNAAPAVGSNVSFTVVVANAANLSNATGVTLTDALPSGYAFVSSTVTQGAYVSSTGVWTVGTVNSGSSATLTVTATVLGSGSYGNTAQVTTADQTDLNSTPNNNAPLENDQSTTTPVPTARVDLSLTKVSTPANPPVGSNVTFTVTVSNAANFSIATGVSVLDQLPSGYTFVSSTPSQGTYVAASGVWTVGTVNAGSSVNLQVIATVLGSGSYANTAQVSAAGQPDFDSTPNNNLATEDDQATDTPTPAARVDLSTTKTFTPASAAVGSNVTFTVTVSNAANLSSATGVVVNDLLPSGYTLVSSTPSQGAYVPATGVWTVGTINSGSSANIQIVGTVQPSGPYANTAQVTAAGQTDIDSTPGDGVGDDFATATPPITAAIDLSVTKTSSPANPPVGSNVTFTVTVANAANLSSATGVAITDLLPSGYTFVSFTASQGTYVSSTGVWTVGTVNSGSSANIQIIGTVLGSGTYANTAQVTAAGQTDIDSTPNDGVGDDFATNTPTPAPRINLSMTKTATPSNPAVGTNVTFTLTVSNAANLNNATGVVVRDQLPSGYTFVSDNGAGAYVPATGVWTVGNVNSGSSVNLQIVATVRPTGVYTNNTEVTAANQTDTNSLPNDGTGDDFATVTPGATPIADLSLTKTASSATPAVGSDVTFLVTVNNAGPSTATGVVVTDQLPSGYTFVSSTPSQGTYVPASGIWTIGNINPLSSVTLQVTATVKATGAYGNTAQITAVTESDPDSTPNNNAPLEDDQATNTPVPSPRIDLSTTKTVSNAAPAVGSNVIFTVTLANAANLSTATGVTLTDQLPSGYSYVSHTASVGTYVPASGLWTVGSVNSGSSVTLQITATVRPSGIYANTAQVTAALESDINSTPNNNDGSENDQATNAPVPSPRIDLNLTKVSNPVSPAVGSTVTFTLTVSNAGPSSATGVAVTDQLPSGYSFGSSSPSQGAYSAATGIWSVGTLNASGTATLTINATVLATGTYANTAQVTAANETDLDSTPNNNAPAEDDQATSTPTPSPRADLRVNKTVTPTNPAIGTNVTFTVTVGNNGPSSATGVVLTDALPSGFTLVSSTPSQGAYNAGTGVWTVGTIANAGSANLQIVATVRSTGDYTNSAEITASGVIDPTSTPNDGTGDDRDSVGVTPAGFSTLSGRVYADVNLNGADNSEPGIGGVSLLLTGTDISGNPVSINATTDGTGAFSFAGLPPSDGAGYTITQTQPANYTSGATTNGTPGGVNGVNTVSNIVVPANTTGTGYAFGEQRADISVVKTASTTTPAVGSNVTFTVTASNAGPTNASGVVITDALPSGYTYISDTGVGAYVPATGLWTVGSLAASSNATLTITARVNASGNYANTAQLTNSNQADPDSTPSNNNPAEDDQSTSSLTPVSTIDLSVTKTSSPATPAVGSNVTFLITVANAANLSTASGVTITDLLPSGYDFTSATPSSGTYNALTGLWTLGSLNSGSSATLSVVAQVLATGTYANTAQVTAADQPDADSAPNNNAPLEDDQATNTPAPSARADLSLSKTVSNTAPNIGSNVSFVVTLNNAGPSAATGVTVRDVLPSGFTLVSSTPSGATSYAAGTGIWTVNSIASGSSETLTIIATVGASGNYTNVAEVTGSGVTDPDSIPNDTTGDDYATAGVTPAGLSSLTGRVYADVNLSGTDNAEPGIQGVTVTLTGTDANGVPVNLTTTTDATGAYSFAGLLPPQAATTYTLTQTQPANYSGTTSNVGTGAGGVSGSNQVTGIGFPSGTAATGYSFAEARADISVTKSASTTNPNVGTNVTFTVNVSNAGPTNATGVVVADALPSGFTLVGMPSATAGTYSSGTGLWTVGALANGATQTLTVTASVNASGDYTNIAQLTASNQADPNSTPNNNNPSENDQSAAPLTPTPVADIAVTKTGPARVAGGASVTYTVTVVNNGPSSANSVVVTDTLPSALTGVTVSNGGVVTSSSVTWTLPTLAVGAPVSFTVTGTAPVTGTLVNLVSGSSSTLDTTPNNNDSNPANDPPGSPSSVTTQVVSAPTVAKSFAPNPIAAGGTSTLTVTLTNPNTTALTGASITDPLPSGLTPVPGTTATTCGGVVSQTTTALTLTGGTIPASASCTVTVQLRPSSNASGKGAQLNTIPAGALTTNESPASPAPASATLEIASVGAAKSATVPVNNGDGTYSVTYTITLENLGSVALTNVQAIENLSATFPSPASFAIQTAPIAGAGLSVNPAFNGSSNTNLLTAASSSLNVGASRTTVFTVRVTPGATPPTTTFNNFVTATATAPSGLGVSDVSSNSGTDSDPNGNGNPNDPGEDSSTPVNFSENPVIGIAKQAGAPVSNGNGSYTVPFTVVVRNYGDVPLNNLAAIENLTTTFGTALLSSSVPTLATGSAGTVTPNASFSGTGANTNLVATGSSLAVGASATFNFSVVIRPTPSASSFANNVLAQATSPAGTSVTDNSANGLDPNPTPATPPTDDTAITPTVFGLITGQAFADTNGDGVQQASEPNLTGATVTITPNGGTPFTVITDSAGVYSAVVPAGNTSANVSDPAGTILTTANDPQTRLVTAGATATNTPVGFQATAGLVGRVFTDNNGNGVQDAGETGISGLTVTVTPVGGAPVTAITTSSGDYIVTGLTAGQYRVDVSDPAGNVLTTANDPQTVTVAPNGAGRATPVGFQPTGTVLGRVFKDDNGNGSQGATETGLAGVQVRITNGSFSQVVTTDANGDYTLGGVPIGTVTVDIVDSSLPVGVTQTAGTDPSAVTVLAGVSNNAGADGYRLPAPVATNNTATTTQGTPVTFPITADDSATSPLTISASSIDLDPSTPTEDKTRTVAEGTYTANPDGSVTFAPNAASTGSVTPIQYTVKDSSGNLSNAATLAVTIGAATLGDVTGEVFNDLNGNGVKDAGEGLSGVQVTVTSGSSTQTVTTNASGTYTALGLPIGTASVKIVTSTLPAGLTQTVGTDPSTVTVVAGASANAGLDGYRAAPPVAVADTAVTPFNTPVTFPITGNDSASSGSAIDPSTVTFPSAGQPSGSSVSPDGKTLTTPSGVFTVDALGNVTFTPATGFTGTVPSINYTVKDTSGQLSNPAPISVTVSTPTTGVVRGIVYRDDNGNGVQDGSEPGFSGVSVVITPASGPVVTVVTDANGQYSAANIAFGNATVDITDSSLPAGAVATVAGADPTTIAVGTGNNDAGNDGYRLARPVANNDSASTPVGTPVTFSITGNDTASNPYTIVPSSVDLDPATPGAQTTRAVPEGVYAVNGVGEVTFTPTAGFSGNATPINYTVRGSVGQTSNEATIRVVVTPTAANDTATTGLNSPVTIPVLSNDAGSLLPASVAFPSAGQPSGSSVSPDGKTLTVPGVGVYTANPSGTVTFTPANGFSGTAPSVLYSVSDGVTTRTASINVTVTSQTIGGKVFTDTNGNGVQDAGEPNISGATVTITDSLGGTQTVTTDSSGAYTAAVPIGSTTVTVTTPSGTSLTTANNPQTVNVPAGGATAAPVGFQPKATISGVIFTDTNGNGVQDAGEPGISGATVTITPVGGGAPVTVTTDASGNYSAPNLPLGNYTVSTGTPANTTLTTANNPQTVTLPAGGAVSSPIGFKPVTSGGITGKVFNDANGNGVLEAGEAGLSGATVALFEVKPDGTPDLTKPLKDSSGKPITAITDASGNYSFSGIPTGSVAILVTDPSGKVLTTANNPQIVTVPSGTSVTAAAVGYVQPKIDLTLTPDVTVVTPGDNLPYTAVITNNTPGTITPLNNPVFNVTLPKGVLYDPTKPVTVDGVVIPASSISVKVDPTDPTRQILTIKLPTSLVNNKSQTVKFSTVVTPAVDPNKPLIATGQVTATAGAGVTAVSVSSNAVAAAAVRIDLGVFSTDTIILGRVYFDKDDNNNFSVGDVPLPGARVYLSDGRYAVTDTEGRYNITGVKPGSYAVRLDPVTAPYAPKRVPDDGGAPGTRYVNANQGGGISFEDFPLETPLATAVKSRSTIVQRGPVTLEKAITQGGAGYAVTYTITITKAVANLAITDPLPANAERGPVTGATLEGNVLRFTGVTQPGTYTVTFALFSAAPPDLILTDPEILYEEIFTLIPSSPNHPASSGGPISRSINSQEVKR